MLFDSQNKQEVANPLSDHIYALMCSYVVEGELVRNKAHTFCSLHEKTLVRFREGSTFSSGQTKSKKLQPVEKVMSCFMNFFP